MSSHIDDRVHLPVTEAALVVGVPEAELLVGGLRSRYDPVAALGMPAHITINYPFVPGVEPSVDTLSRLSKVLTATQPFSFALDHVGRFPNVVYLAPDPSTPFVQLVEQIAQEFPESPPMEGDTEAARLISLSPNQSMVMYSHPSKSRLWRQHQTTFPLGLTRTVSG